MNVKKVEIKCRAKSYISCYMNTLFPPATKSSMVSTRPVWPYCFFYLRLTTGEQWFPSYLNTLWEHWTPGKPAVMSGRTSSPDLLVPRAQRTEFVAQRGCREPVWDLTGAQNAQVGLTSALSSSDSKCSSKSESVCLHFTSAIFLDKLYVRSG